MKEIRQVYVAQIKRNTTRWGLKVLLAYGLLAILAAASGVFQHDNK